MSRGFRPILARALCTLAAFALISVAAPGCGDEAKKPEAKGEAPANVQESNKNMENFMKKDQGKK